MYLNQTFFNSLILINEVFFYYLLIFLNLILFLVSLNFRPLKFYQIIRNSFQIFNKKNQKNYTDKSEIIDEYIPQEEIKNLIQEDLPFIKAENKNVKSTKFKLPNLDLLKTPSKKERQKPQMTETQDPEFLEKILLDFGVDGNVKKVSHGPVVTLNDLNRQQE